MLKALNVVSIVLISVLLITIVSQKFFPIEGLEILYEKKFYLAFAYIILRLVRTFILKKEQKQK